MSKAQSNNRIIVAPAGGRKTSLIVEDALNQPKNKKILITTYTLENLDQIKDYIVKKNGCIPPNISISSWFSFLLIDGVRPYQNYLIRSRKVKSIDFETKPARYIGKKQLAYFLNKADNMYKDRVSDFVCMLCGASDGKVVRRIEDIYDAIYIDEMQDLSGWDQTFIDLLLESKVQMTLVGDPRQTTYSTTNSLKNRGLAGNKMMIWIKKQEKKDLCTCEEKVECFRSNQDICDFADSIYPDLPKTISKNVPDTIHDGIFEITSQDLVQYLENYSPVMLRWDKNTNTFGYQAINIGMSKGKTYERVLVFPTKTMSDFLKNRNPEELKPRTRSKLYVAVTRARYSVAFLTN